MFILFFRENKIKVIAFVCLIILISILLDGLFVWTYKNQQVYNNSSVEVERKYPGETRFGEYI